MQGEGSCKNSRSNAVETYKPLGVANQIIVVGLDERVNWVPRQAVNRSPILKARLCMIDESLKTDKESRQ